MTKHVAGAAKANEEERERAKGRAFSTEEDDTLRKARGQPGWTWKEITSQLPGRSERATRDRWTRTLCEALQPRQLDRQQQPQTPKQRTVRFECDGCGKRLKAKVPTGVGRFRTKCSDCGKWLEKVPQDLQAKLVAPVNVPEVEAATAEAPTPMQQQPKRVEQQDQQAHKHGHWSEQRQNTEWGRALQVCLRLAFDQYDASHQQLAPPATR